jgi:phosphoribosylformylglycinamidine synthase
MAAAFMDAGFQAWDVTMRDLLNGTVSLREFQGIAFVGGFSYADVLDSAKGWSGMIQFNDNLREQFNRFYMRSDTFSLGVCNGCQLMALLGWVPKFGLNSIDQPRFIRNQSGRFESRFSTIAIAESPAIMLQGMAGSILGVWVAHGEGQLHAKPDQIDKLVNHGLAPIRYVDQRGKPTEAYPHNPNGSPGGITAICSEDGRHLAMMPHPERTFQLRQWPWAPEEWKHLLSSPWFRMFQNAFEWCVR